jgi:hypothetical protein
MAATPRGSWPGGSQFGLRDLLEQSRMRPEKVQLALGEMNRALQSLDIRHYRAVGISCESAPGEEMGRWIVTLASVDDPAKILRWGGGAE